MASGAQNNGWNSYSHMPVIVECPASSYIQALKIWQKHSHNVKWLSVGPSKVETPTHLHSVCIAERTATLL